MSINKKDVVENNSIVQEVVELIINDIIREESHLIVTKLVVKAIVFTVEVMIRYTDLV